MGMVFSSSLSLASSRRSKVLLVSSCVRADIQSRFSELEMAKKMWAGWSGSTSWKANFKSEEETWE